MKNLNKMVKRWKKLLVVFMVAVMVSSPCLAPAVADAAQQAGTENADAALVSPDAGISAIVPADAGISALAPADAGISALAPADGGSSARLSRNAGDFARLPREVVQLRVHSRVGGANWTPVLDLSDAYMRTKIDFYVQDKGNQVNELVGDAYTVQWISEDGTVLPGSPANAGEYTVKVILDDSLAGTAEMAEDTFSFTVRKMNLSSPGTVLQVYGKTPQWTGNPVLPGNPYVANSNYQMPEDTYDLEFVEGKNCTEIGTAYVKAVAKGPNVVGEKEFRYQIVKAQLDREYFKERMVTDFTYDGTAKQPMLEGDYPEIAEVQYLYYFDQWNKRMDGAPKDTGSYSSMVRLIPRDTEHYQNNTWTQEFEIAPRKLEADVQVEKSKVYDSSSNVESPTVTITNLVEGDEVELSATAQYDNKNAGRNKTVTVSYRMSGKDAGKYLAPDELRFTDGEILPKEIEVGNIVLQSYYYNGNREVPLDETSITDKSHWALVGSYSSVDDVAMDLSEVRAFMEDADAGVDKPVTFSGFKLTGADSGNYTLPQPSRTVTIRRIGFAGEVQMDDYQYANTVPQPQLLRYGGDGQVVYKYREVGSQQAYREWKDIGPETLKPGEYEMIAEISDTVNYEGGTTVYPGKFKVSRFSPQVEGSAKWEKTYGDEPFYLDATQKGDGQLRYQLIRGEDVVSLGADGKVTVLKAGEARIYVSAEQTEYYEREGLWIDISVEKLSKPENMPTGEQTKIKASSEMDKLADIPLPEGWHWKEPDTKLIPGGVLVAEAVYEDTDNYEQHQVQIEISKEAEEPPVDLFPEKPLPGDGKPQGSVLQDPQLGKTLRGGEPQDPRPREMPQSFKLGEKPQDPEPGETPQGSTPQDPEPGETPQGSTPQNPAVEYLSGSSAQAQGGKLLISRSSGKPESGEGRTDSDEVQNSAPKETEDSIISQNPTLDNTSDMDAQTDAGSDAGTESKSESNVKAEGKSFVGWYVLLIVALIGLLVVLIWRRRRKE